MSTTALDESFLLDALGVSVTAEDVAGYLARLGFANPSDDEAAVKLGIRAADYPMHQAVMAAFGPDGTGTDPAAFATVLELAR